MVPTRRRLLAATAGLSVLAGCSSLSIQSDEQFEYALTVDRIERSLIENALYEPSDDPLFGTPAATALDEILPEGRYSTDGYKSVPTDAYVEHDGRYYQTGVIVTGRTKRDRRVVYAERVPEDDKPDDALVVDELDRVDARVVKIHKSASETGDDELLTDADGYVLRRPAEREGEFASGDLDGRVISMTEGGPWVYRFNVRTHPVLETVYTAYAVEVADSREAFREVVFGDRVDVELSLSGMPRERRDMFERAKGRSYRETTPLSKEFTRLLDQLELDDVGEPGADNGNLCWDGETLYRYGLYVNPAD